MAWALYSTFVLNAKIQHRRATFLHFLLSFLNVAATVLAVLHMVLLVEYQGSDFEVEYSGTVRNLLPVMPILSGLVMTISGKFSPILKWATLRSGAEQIKTEIYLYRARVGDYTPRVRNSIDIMAKIEKMEDKRTVDRNPSPHAVSLLDVLAFRFQGELEAWEDGGLRHLSWKASGGPR